MEENTNPEHLLNKYFEAAKKEPTIVSATEIENLIAKHEAGKISESTLARYKYWIAGGIGLLVVGFYFALTYSSVIVSAPTQKSESQIAKEKITTNTEAANQSSQSQENTIRPIENKKLLNDSNTKSESSVSEKIKPQRQITNKVQTKKDTFYFQGDANINFEFDGNDVKMVIGNNIKKLEINGVKINESDFVKYEKIIAQGNSLKIESDKMLSNKSEAETNAKQKNQEVMNGLLNKLQNDGWIDTSSHFEFRLTGSQLFIGNVQKTKEDFERYKQYYESISGNKLNAKSNIKIKH